MAPYLIDLPNEILLNIISFKHNLFYDNFKNVRYLMRLSRVCKKFYWICHAIKKEYLFFTINYISLCDGMSLNKNHAIFTKGIINNWSNLNIILSLHFKCDLTYFNIYKKSLSHYKNIHIAFNIENYVDEFIEFYDDNRDYLERIKYSININFHNICYFSIQKKLNKIKDKFVFRNVTFLHCRNIKIPALKMKKLKISHSQNIIFLTPICNINKLYIKNSKHIIFCDIMDVGLIHLKCCYNIIFSSIKNINQFKLIDSRIIFNKKIENINLLLVKMINNSFIIPDNSSIHKFIYLYNYCINNYTLDTILREYNITSSKVNNLELVKSRKK